MIASTILHAGDLTVVMTSVHKTGVRPDASSTKSALLHICEILYAMSEAYPSGDRDRDQVSMMLAGAAASLAVDANDLIHADESDCLVQPCYTPPAPLPL